MGQPKVVVTDYNYPDLKIEEELLSEIGVDFTVSQCKTPEEVIDAAEGADALLNQYTEITEEVFSNLPNLKAISIYGIGVDSVNIESATAHGVSVFNVPSYCEGEVSDHTLALILSCLRKVPFYDRDVRSGYWDWKSRAPIARIDGLVLGLLAFGKISQMVAEKSQVFGLRPLVYDPYVDQEVMTSRGVKVADTKEEVLAKSDVLSIHTPLTEGTRHLIGREDLKKMKSDAVLINTSRGPVVDNEALRWALETSQIAGAGLDVIEDEPSEGSVADHPLTGLDKAILTPHVAWYSEEAVAELRRKTAMNIACFLQGDPPQERLVNPETLSLDPEPEEIEN